MPVDLIGRPLMLDILVLILSTPKSCSKSSMAGGGRGEVGRGRGEEGGEGGKGEGEGDTGTSSSMVGVRVTYGGKRWRLECDMNTCDPTLLQHCPFTCEYV